MRFMKGPLTRFEYGFMGQVYETIIRTPIMGLAKAMRVMDSDFINEGGESLARSTRKLSETMKAKVGGHAQHYGLLMAFGVILFFLWAVTLR